jgi:cytochrome c-type biogenesis protein CcmH/NrfG
MKKVTTVIFRKPLVIISVSFIVGVIAGCGLLCYLSKQVDAYSADAAMLSANDAFNHNDMNTAAAYAYEAMFKNPNSYNSYMLLGAISERKGDSEYSVKMLKAALQTIDKTNGIGGGVFSGDEQKKTAQIDRAIIEDKLKALQESTHK